MYFCIVGRASIAARRTLSRVRGSGNGESEGEDREESLQEHGDATSAVLKYEN